MPWFRLQQICIHQCGLRKNAKRVAGSDKHSKIEEVQTPGSLTLMVPCWRTSLLLLLVRIRIWASLAANWREKMKANILRMLGAYEAKPQQVINHYHSKSRKLPWHGFISTSLANHLGGVFTWSIIGTHMVQHRHHLISPLEVFPPNDVVLKIFRKKMNSTVLCTKSPG